MLKPTAVEVQPVLCLTWSASCETLVSIGNLADIREPMKKDFFSRRVSYKLITFMIMVVVKSTNIYTNNNILKYTKTCFMFYVNNKDADQRQIAHPYGIVTLECIIEQNRTEQSIG